MSSEEPIERSGVGASPGAKIDFNLAVEPDKIDDDSVAAYLLAHPDFLARRPDVLEHMSLEHPVGEAVSLIEYQLRLLRESNEDLRSRLKNLVANARDNEDIGRRVHRLCLHLLQCNGVDEIFSHLYQRLADEFQAEFAAVRVFVSPRDGGDSRLGEFGELEPSAATRIDRTLRRGKPVCGKLDPSILEPLFQERTAEIGSSALVALGDGNRVGVLALGSRSAQRFRRGTGTIFIQQIGDIVSHALLPYLSLR